MVADAAAKAKTGQWIVGRGWHQDKWTSRPQPNVEGFPTHPSLDEVSPDNPVVLTHASGHGSFVNARAMALSNITRSTPQPPGGEIVKDASGDPIGFLRETATSLVRRGAGEPAPTPDARAARTREVLRLADEEVVAKGITSFQDAGSSFETIDAMKTAIDDGALRVRLWVMVRADNAALAQQLDRYRLVGYAGDRLTVRAIKVTIDGALGSRGAWLLAPYADKPDSVGLATTPVESVKATAQLAIDHRYQLAIHAIGDRANREVLDIYEEAFRKSGGSGRDLRWRIEHAQHLSAADIPRFGRLGCRLGARSPRQPAHRRRRLRLAEADEEWRRGHQRKRRPRRRRRPAGRLLRDRDAQARQRGDLLSGPAHDAHGGASFLHDSERVRRVRGVRQGVARRR
jgi:predicted amidohydrolase YtcJ